jgi:uncharacterized protein (DUF927 family)
MYVSQNIEIKDMDKQLLEAELETSDSLLTLEIDMSDGGFDEYLEEPEKYVVFAPKNNESEAFLKSLDEIDLTKPLEFDKDLGLGSSQELDIDFGLDLER